jgi:hypothetical protein
MKYMSAAVAGLELTSDFDSAGGGAGCVEGGTHSVDDEHLISSSELGENRQPPLRSCPAELELRLEAGKAKRERW